MAQSIREQLESEQRETKFDFIGKVFYGRKNISKKDQSYTASLWLTFFYLPIIPYDTYRIFPDLVTSDAESRVLPRVFHRDDYIPYKTIRLNFDWSQVIFTLLSIWGSIILYLYLVIILNVQFGPFVAAAPLPPTIGLIFVGILLTNKSHKKKIAALQAELAAKTAAKKAFIPPAPAKVKESFVFPSLDASVKVEPAKPVERTLPSDQMPIVFETPKAEDMLAAVPPALEEKPVEIKPEPVVPPAPAPEPEPVVAPEPEPIPKPEPTPEPVIEKPAFKPEPQVAFNKAPVAAAVSEAIHPHTVPDFSKPASQKAFNPDSVFETPVAASSLYNVSELEAPSLFSPLELFGIFNLFLCVAYFLLDIYYTIDPNVTGNLANIHSVFDFLVTFHLMTFTGILVGLLLAFKRNVLISYPLLFLAIAIWFGYHRQLFDYLDSI